ncbi:hypothetical protein EVAR_83785_1 [Eumeta japonica]|uniref:Uncharacterized protein n=1 Tax=Eumeta variegata TaxID=151549 RepID=A0A4C1WEL8_EUMVA|nr:hypothetical protein EVAR_83785_1 [Eumeta japonica]
MGINPLDSACREHDIAYSKNRKNVHLRNQANRVLASKVMKLVFDRDASPSERAVALGLASAMAAKAKCGVGIKSALTGGVAAILKAVNNAKDAIEQFKEQKRHNEKILWVHSSRKQAAGLTDLPAPTAANPRQYFQDFPQIAISSAVLSSTDLRWFGKVW